MRKLYFIIMLLPLLTGCLGNPLFKPSQRLVKTVGPEYKVYVQNDKKLTKDQKARRINSLEECERLLKDYEEVEGD